MKEHRKKFTEKVAGLRTDYLVARARIYYLKAEGIESEELEQLERWKNGVDAIVDCFPESQQQILRLCVLDDMPVTKAAYEVGYHYTWVLTLRDKAVADLERVLDEGPAVVSELGLKIKEKLNAIDS